jgi:hypothetical protein
MTAMWKSILAIIVFGFSLAACAVPGTATSQTPSAQSSTGTLKFSAPAEWVAEKATSSMRVAQYKLPKVAGDEEDGSLVIYYFGQGQGGTAAANIERWVNQMKQPDGGSSKGRAKESSQVINGLKVDTVDISGTYTAEMAPGSGTFQNKPNFRMRAAVVETPKGSYFIKLVGPEKTINNQDQPYATFLKSLEFK